MIRSNGGVRLLSCLLNRDACKSICEGVFNRTLNSGLWTLSRVIGGDAVRQGHGVNLKNRGLPSSSIRGSSSLSKDSNYAAFVDWAPKRLEKDKNLMFDYYRDVHIEHASPPHRGIIPTARPENCINCSPKFGKHRDYIEEISEEIKRQGHGFPHSEKVYRKVDSVIADLCHDCARRMFHVVV